MNEVYAEKRGNTLWKRAGRLMIRLNGDVKKEFSNNSLMTELLLQLDFCTMVEYIALHRKRNIFFLILILHNIKSINLSQLRKQKFLILSFG